MFNTLLESRGNRALATRGRWTAISAAVHATLITGAVVATATSSRTMVTREPPATIHYAPIVRASPPPPATTRRFVLSGDRPTISIDLPRIPVPGPVDLGRRDIGNVIEYRDGGAPLGGNALTSAPGGVFTVATVDRVVAARPGNPSPAYPNVLRSSGLAGTVVVRFVVDTNGVLEPGSMEILHATHSAFADAVRAWLPRTRYFAAEAAGRRVRQLVEQRVEFQLR